MPSLGSGAETLDEELDLQAERNFNLVIENAGLKRQIASLQREIANLEQDKRHLQAKLARLMQLAAKSKSKSQSLDTTICPPPLDVRLYNEGEAQNGHTHNGSG